MENFKENFFKTFQCQSCTYLTSLAKMDQDPENGLMKTTCPSDFNSEDVDLIFSFPNWLKHVFHYKKICNIKLLMKR